jgi:hypothetical protein
MHLYCCGQLLHAQVLRIHATAAKRMRPDSWHSAPIRTPINCASPYGPGRQHGTPIRRAVRIYDFGPPEPYIYGNIPQLPAWVVPAHRRPCRVDLPVLCENFRRMLLLIRSSACLERNVIHAMDSVEWECGDACRAWICLILHGERASAKPSSLDHYVACPDSLSADAVTPEMPDPNIKQRYVISYVILNLQGLAATRRLDKSTR